MRIARRSRILRFPDLHRMPVRVIKTEYPLSPSLPFDRMYQLDMWCNDFESRLDILVFEIQQQVSSPIGFFPSRCLPPDRLLKRCSFVDRKTGLEEDEISEILQYPEAEPLPVELLGAADVADERDRIDKTHRISFVTSRPSTQPCPGRSCVRGCSRPGSLSTLRPARPSSLQSANGSSATNNRAAATNHGGPNVQSSP